MKNPFSSRELSDSMRRRVELAVAVAQERLLSTHVDHALRLIQLMGDQVPFENVLGIYTRMLRLTDDEARVITTRSLAILGEQVRVRPAVPDVGLEASETPPEETQLSFLRLMRQRLRGRVKDDLRRSVELAAARTEVAILNAHVDNAKNFIDLLDKEQSPAEAVEMYLESLEVRESISEVTFYMALARVADEELPDVNRRTSPTSRRATEPAAGARVEGD